jgi:hypothetical protein
MVHGDDNSSWGRDGERERGGVILVEGDCGSSEWRMRCRGRVVWGGC